MIYQLFFLIEQSTYNIVLKTEQQKYDAYQVLQSKGTYQVFNNAKFQAGNSDFMAKMTYSSHLSDAQFAYEHLGLSRKKLKVADGVLPLVETLFDKSTFVPLKCQSLPASKNWADEGKMAQIQDQKKCKSSFLFSSIGALESYAAIEYKIPVKKLSAQNTLECVKNFTTESSNTYECNVGQPEWVWKYARDQIGLVAESSYKSYNGNPGEDCISTLMKESNTEVHHWEQIPAGDEEAMKCHIATVGPLSVEMVVGKTTFDQYASGLWDDYEMSCTGKEADHVSFKTSRLII
jgi:Papain family cysteine protease